MRANLPVRRAQARRLGELFIFPLLVLATIASVAAVSILWLFLWLPIGDRGF